MNDIEIQAWLRKVDSKAGAKILAIGLLDADDDIKNLIFRNMSNQAGKILSEGIEKNKRMKIKERVVAMNADILENLIGG